MMEEKIRKLAKKRNAVILAHNYQPPEIQDIADLCGDSLELSIKAAKTDADVIVFCGVHFMAETAYILSPNKTVLLPRKDAGCPMADMVTPAGLTEKIKEMRDIPVVTYVNSPADVKALSTICCTSANALEVVASLDAEAVLMVPDRNLAQNTAAKTDKKIYCWNGFCPIHDRLTVEEALEVKKKHPDALFMAHPECRPDVVALADVSLSTSGMIRYAAESDHTSFIVGTEIGMLHPLKKAAPDKIFIPASEKMTCENMKKISLEDIVHSLEALTPKITVPEAIRTKALTAVERMIELKS
ncbi:MAG: quinolinate synthase NadA [Desulfobacterales bacterium]